MLTPLLVVVGLVVLILGHEAGHFFAAKALKMKVEEFGFGFPPKIFGKRKGETEYSLNWLPFGGFVRIAGENDRLSGETEKIDSLPPAGRKRLFMFQAPWRKGAVVLAGVAANLLIGWLVLSTVFMLGTGPVLQVYGVQPGSPAEAAGVRTGDVIQNFTSVEEFIAYSGANRGREVSVKIQRGEETLTFKLIPRKETVPGEGAVGIIFAGIAPRGPLMALTDGFWGTLAVAQATWSGLFEILKGVVFTGSVPEGVIGPVGIFSLAAQTAQTGVVNFLQLLALISVNLAIVNLIPFPALDGGRFILVVVEKFKGSPVPRRAEMWLNGLGFALLLLLMIVVTFRDVVNLN